MKCKNCKHFRGDQCYVNLGMINAEDEACGLFTENDATMTDNKAEVK